ncbi:MAG: ATP-binding protein [Hydrogenophaga sp.]|uniref:ATP-binding protein n=1 Tax=Hydrogenophaga sp. TaxID=1904254 RepID=UPI0027354402|nr:ATP-binding protein [Hydrogenophaga sp.]MDP3626986.1 ATP-binding protein [Hydrogenophaga sp.]
MRVEHPLTRKCGPRFPLPPLREFSINFSNLCYSAEPALTCIGMPDTGKSTAFLFIKEHIIKSKKAAVYHAVMAQDDGTSRQLARELVSSEAGLIQFNITSDEALVRRAQADCDSLGVGRVIILIDEAQLLNKRQLEYLRGVMQKFSALDLGVFFALFAQPEILAIPKTFKERGDASLVNRFMSRQHRFRGLRRSEFKVFLECLDSTRWPESGPTYTEHFARSFWAAGGRMLQLDEYFQNSFTALAQKAGRDLDDIPTKYIASASKYMLDAISRQAPSPVQLPGLVDHAARASGVVTAWEFLGDLETDMRNRAPRPKKSRV